MSAGGNRSAPEAPVGQVQVYTGAGKGKTTAAVGLAVRALGNGLRVYLCQFLKGRPTGEMKSLERFGDSIRIERFGRTAFVRPGKITEADRRAAREGFEAATRAVLSGGYDLAILDEIGPACALGLVEPARVLDLMRSRPGPLELVLTGRDMPAEIVAAADLVTEMAEVKHYYRDGAPPRRGIEF